MNEADFSRAVIILFVGEEITCDQKWYAVFLFGACLIGGIGNGCDECESAELYMNIGHFGLIGRKG